MKKLLIITLLIISNIGYSQSNEIKVEFMGNAGLYLTDGNLNVYIDFPYKSGAYGYMEYENAELDSIKENSMFLFTHRHADHYSKKLLKKIKKEKNGKVYGNWNTKKLEKLNSSIEDFSIQSFKTKHAFTFKHYSYLITWHNQRIFISGDTTLPETIGTLKNLNWAFIPYWLYENAKLENVSINTDYFGIYHLYPNEKIEEGLPNNIHFLWNQNKVITIPYK